MVCKCLLKDDIKAFEYLLGFSKLQMYEALCSPWADKNCSHHTDVLLLLSPQGAPISHVPRESHCETPTASHPILGLALSMAATNT